MIEWNHLSRWWASLIGLTFSEIWLICAETVPDVRGWARIYFWYRWYVSWLCGIQVNKGGTYIQGISLRMGQRVHLRINLKFCLSLLLWFIERRLLLYIAKFTKTWGLVREICKLTFICIRIGKNKEKERRLFILCLLQEKRSYCTRRKWDSLCGIIIVFGHRSIFYQYQWSIDKGYTWMETTDCEEIL